MQTIEIQIFISELYAQNISYNNVGINESRTNTKNITIYPNPTYDKVTIQSELKNIEIKLYDITGKLINSSIEENTLSLEHLESGVYFIKTRVNKEKNWSIYKIIKL